METDKERFVRRGREKIKATFAAQPYRGSPSWADLHTLAEALLSHIVSDRGEPDEPDDVEDEASGSNGGLTSTEIAALVTTADDALTSTQVDSLTSTEAGTLTTSEIGSLAAEPTGAE